MNIATGHRHQGLVGQYPAGVDGHRGGGARPRVGGAVRGECHRGRAACRYRHQGFASQHTAGINRHRHGAAVANLTIDLARWIFVPPSKRPTVCRDRHAMKLSRCNPNDSLASQHATSDDRHRFHVVVDAAVAELLVRIRPPSRDSRAGPFQHQAAPIAAAVVGDKRIRVSGVR